MYVLKVLRSHGLNDAALKDIYRSVVMAKLLYASSAWWGFATASDKHRIEAFVRRCVRLQLYGAADPTIQLLPNSQKMPMKLCLARSDETDIGFFPESNCH